MRPAPARPAAGSRVLIVADAVFGGGAERHVVDLALGLRERGWDVTVACSCAGSEGDECRRAVERLRGPGVPVHDLLGYLAKRRLCLPYAARLWRLVRSGDFDIVHAHIYASQLAAALALFGSAVPLVVSEHTEGPWKGRSARVGSRWVYRRADSIIAVSQAIVAKLCIGYHVPPQRVAVVTPVGRTEVTCAHPVLERPPDLPNGPLVGFVGRLQPEKGVDVLLHAMARVLGSQPAARLVVIGTGPERARLEELARRLRITDAVRFLGYRADAATLLGGFDVLAVPSRTDGTPLVVHEGMSAGVAVVGSATGGIVDRLQDASAGLLVPPGDPPSLAAAILRLLGDDHERRVLAQAGRRAAAAMTYDRMLDAVEQVYAAVLAARAARSGGEPFTGYPETADVNTRR